MAIPFSVKYGGRKQRVDIQLKEMDDRLRNRLWNCLSLCFFNEYREIAQYYDIPASTPLSNLTSRIWHNFYGEPIDIIPASDMNRYNKIREKFFKMDWDLAYEFCQFVVENYDSETKTREFVGLCNDVLETEKSGYRFIDNTLTDIISSEDIKEIEKALNCPADPVRELFNKSLREYSDRNAPDYPNSIKDSISAVESLCKTIAGDGSKTLGQALPTVTKKLGIDTVLMASIEKIWAFRNTKEGVGHGSTESINVTPGEARLCIITCSAWINFLNERSQQKGVRLSKK
ncbi:MAG: hypothetical protein SA339_05015 [Methanomassiliicoccus sp.]|nr:hypothetical protein [Methanomassiliicoccus sp.]